MTNQFSIYGFAQLSEQLAKINNIRMLFPGIELASDEKYAMNLIGSAGERKYRNRLDMASIARVCAEWLEKCAEIKGVDSPLP
jgi:hypothetical protein